MSTEGNNKTLENDRIESLRLILEREQKRTISYDEALEIGESLISFFVILAEESNTPTLSAQAA
jgi:hypothetical protein